MLMTKNIEMELFDEDLKQKTYVGSNPLDQDVWALFVDKTWDLVKYRLNRLVSDQENDQDIQQFHASLILVTRLFNIDYYHDDFTQAAFNRLIDLATAIKDRSWFDLYTEQLPAMMLLLRQLLYDVATWSHDHHMFEHASPLSLYVLGHELTQAFCLNSVAGQALDVSFANVIAAQYVQTAYQEERNYRYSAYYHGYLISKLESEASPNSDNLATSDERIRELQHRQCVDFFTQPIPGLFKPYYAVQLEIIRQLGLTVGDSFFQPLLSLARYFIACRALTDASTCLKQIDDSLKQAHLDELDTTHWTKQYNTLQTTFNKALQPNHKTTHEEHTSSTTHRLIVKQCTMI